MFSAYAEELRAGPPIAVWRARFATGEGEIADLLERAVAGWPEVEVGSYPRFEPTGPEVEIVLKAAQATRSASSSAGSSRSWRAAAGPPRADCGGVVCR